MEYTALENLQSEYSDFFKEVHGFRPRFMSDEQWSSEQWLSDAILGLAFEAQEKRDREDEAYAQNIDRLENEIVDLIQTQEVDRETAIRWIMDADDIDDVGMFEFRRGVPYGYLEQAAQIVNEICQAA